MVKRLLTLVAIAATAVGLTASPLAKNPAARAKGFTPSKSVWKSSSPAEMWYGYFDGDEARSGVGTGAAETYEQAIFLPGNGVALGKTIKAVRFYLAASSTINVKVWLDTELTAGTHDVEYEIPASDLNISAEDETGNYGVLNEFTLPEAYTVGEEGVYVGYSYTIDSTTGEDNQYPIVFADTNTIEPNANWVRTSNNVPEWSNLAENGFGNIAIKALIAGDFEDYAASVGSIPEVVAAQKDNTSGVLATWITNEGAKDITSITYAITDKGVAPTEADYQELEITALKGIGAKGTIAIEVEPEAELGSVAKTLHIVKVNGEPNALTAAADFTLTTISQNTHRNVVVEEFTGTGCGWCPRGLVGMKKLREAFPDNFIGIGVHGYNSTDPMYLNPSTAYPRIFSGSAPSCLIDRKGEIDPYYGSGSDILLDFAAELAIPAKVGVEVEGAFNDDNTEVTATASITPLLNAKGYHVEYVVIADGVESTAASFKQSNYYNGMEILEEDLQWLATAGNKITWTYDDVALVASYKSGKVQTDALADFVADEVQTNTYTLKMPTKAALLKALNYEQIYVVALVVDNNGIIANAAKALVKAGSGVEAASIDSKNAVEVARYAIDGRQLSAPQQGINIVRYSDGSVRKVFVR